MRAVRSLLVLLTCVLSLLAGGAPTAFAGSVEGADSSAATRTAVFAEFTVTPSNPDYWHQEVTVTGRLVAEDSVAQEQTPMAGADFQLSAGDFSETVTTDSDGRFTRKFTPTWEVVRVSAAYNFTPAFPDVASSAPAEQTVTTTKAATRVSVDSTEFTIGAGEQAAITGLAEVENGSEWQPLPDSEVHLWWNNEAWGGGQATVRTASDGRFTALVAPKGSSWVGVEVAGPSEPFLLGSQGPDVRVNVQQPTAITGFTVTRLEDGQLRMRGFVTSENVGPRDAPVVIEYSRDGKSGWAAVRTLRTGEGSVESNEFDATFPSAGKGYYRAFYAGDSGHTAAYSEVRRAR